MQKVLVICGPTCVGKTDLSISLAKLFNGEIINGDSMQVYKEMNIGTAKITDQEKQGITHHLFDIRTIKESFSVADCQKLVRDKIEEISSKAKLPIICGGTGLYLKACLYDYEFIEESKDEETFDDIPTEDLYRKLEESDKDTALLIHPNNRQRIVRAINLFNQSGKGKAKIISEQIHKPIFDVYYLGLTRPREELYSLIDKRVDIMMNQGLLDEVKYVYENANKDSTCLQAIGYKEFFPYFKGEESLENCIIKVKMNTHKFAKRQYTWFNHQMDVKWYDVSNKSMKEVLDETSIKVKEWLINE